ncbi:MAG: hypothetical protein K2P79_14690 [Sphingomonas sp.]|nr:hypothetical protein [Sphingomonas sp.]
MRIIASSICVITAIALSACGKDEDKAAYRAAAAGFEPPMVMNRSDFAARIDKRFDRLDADHDTSIFPSELTERQRKWLMTFDADRDGKLSRDEFTKADLTRFDRADKNGDGTVTTQERNAFRFAN